MVGSGYRILPRNQQGVGDPDGLPALLASHSRAETCDVFGRFLATEDAVGFSLARVVTGHPIGIAAIWARRYDLCLSATWIT